MSSRDSSKGYSGGMSSTKSNKSGYQRERGQSSHSQTGSNHYNQHQDHQYQNVQYTQDTYPNGQPRYADSQHASRQDPYSHDLSGQYYASNGPVGQYQSNRYPTGNSQSRQYQNYPYQTPSRGYDEYRNTQIQDDLDQDVEKEDNDYRNIGAQNDDYQGTHHQHRRHRKKGNESEQYHNGEQDSKKQGGKFGANHPTSTEPRNHGYQPPRYGSDVTESDPWSSYNTRYTSFENEPKNKPRRRGGR